MEVIESFWTCYSISIRFSPSRPSTVVVIVTGWILSQRHRYVTPIIFSCGQVGIGHRARVHRFSAMPPGTSTSSPCTSPSSSSPFSLQAP